MWSIVDVTVNGAAANAAFTDGAPLSARRGGAPGAVRLWVEGAGGLDFASLLIDANGQSRLAIGGVTYCFVTDISISIVIRSIMLRGAPTFVAWPQAAGAFAGVATPLIPTTELTPSAYAAVQEMETFGIIPYRNDPNGGKSKAQIEALGRQYFPYSPHSYELALSVYDWTTADFFRMDLFNLYRYTQAPGEPLDSAQIAQGIWTSRWGSYTPSDPDFMNSFLMSPASTLGEVERQLSSVENKLSGLLAGLKAATQTAMMAMPRTLTSVYPALYSGQVAIQNLGQPAMAVYFEEYPGNAGPVGSTMGMPIDEALKGFMAPNATLTLKSFISFTNDQEGAMHYSNGILLSLTPPSGKVDWGEDITYITPLSDQDDKIEYTLHPGAQLVVTGTHQETFSGKTITVIDLSLERLFR